MNRKPSFAVFNLFKDLALKVQVSKVKLSKINMSKISQNKLIC